ncbi:MAG: NUDIX hydrolase [Rhabdochlamydiaceae bacterium]|jgi:8-oxo-dGTP pyrophosphatase MutT (NUDIX family)
MVPPWGKLEEGETPEQGAIRELFEETGIVVEHASQIRYTRSLYIQKPGASFVFHMFRVCLDKAPPVLLSDESQDYMWATPQEIEKLPLITGGAAVLSYRNSPKRTGASVNAFLILRQNNQVLFHLRKNTGYSDGMWGVISGHVEDGEAATAGMIREAKEEIGITISPADLRIVHVVHRKTARFNIDIFFDCNTWKGEITNMEPNKCEKLAFFSLDALPENTILANKRAFQHISEGTFYSELGWDD